MHIQDDFKGQVNLALMCLWLDDLNLQVNSSLYQAFEAALASSSEKLTPLRAARRQLKNQLSTEQYQQLLNIELEVEKQQQRALVDCLDNDMLSTTSTPQNFQYYLERLGVTELS